MSGRIRSIKPDWLVDERLVLASDSARVLTVALLLMADDYGNGRANRVVLASHVFPGAPPKKLTDALAEVVDVLKFAELYEVDGQSYFHIRNWEKHQRVSHPGNPHVPGPPGAAKKLKRISRKSPETPPSSSGCSPESLGKEMENLAPRAIPSLPFLSDPEGVQGEPPTEAAPKPKPADPFADSMRGKGPGARPDVQQVFERFKKAVERPALKFLRGAHDLQAVTLAEAIDAAGMADCLLVADECRFDRWVLGQADERGNDHKSVAYVFGNPTAFARILAAAQKKQEKAAAVRSTADLQREAMDAEADLSDYQPPKKESA